MLGTESYVIFQKSDRSKIPKIERIGDVLGLFDVYAFWNGVYYYCSDRCNWSLHSTEDHYANRTAVNPENMPAETTLPFPPTDYVLLNRVK